MESGLNLSLENNIETGFTATPGGFTIHSHHAPLTVLDSDVRMKGKTFPVNRAVFVPDNVHAGDSLAAEDGNETEHNPSRTTAQGGTYC